MGTVFRDCHLFTNLLADDELTKTSLGIENRGNRVIGDFFSIQAICHLFNSIPNP